MTNEFLPDATIVATIGATSDRRDLLDLSRDRRGGRDRTQPPFWKAVTKTLDEKMNELIQPDGGLYGLGWYIGWTPGSEEAVLDGFFTAEELRWIADYMEKHNGR